MKKHLLSLLVLFSVFAVNAQTVIEAKQVKAVDSLKLKTDWITNIIKDSSLTGATVRNFPATDAVVKYIANRLAYTVKYSDTAGLIAGYVRETRFLDSLAEVQIRIQTKLTKADADTYYPATQRMIDSLTAVQSRIQSKLTKTDADTYYPATQRMIDSLTAVQSRIQSKLTKSDADTYYPATQRMIDSLTAVQERIQTKQPLLGYTAENIANKATDFVTINNTLYPTVQAVSNYTQSALTGVLKDRGNYDASANVFPSSGGSGSGGAIKTGDMWYISVGGTLGGKAVTAGAWVRSLTDAPGQTAGNWAIADGGFGFVPENVANKSTNTSLGTSNTLYPSQNAVKAYVDAVTANSANWDAAYNDKINSITFSASTITLTQQDGGTVTQSVPTLNQNTTGNAATATNATQWNGYTITNTTANAPTYLLGYNNGAATNSFITAAQVQTWLGLGSNAYTSTAYLPLTAGSGNRITSDVFITNGYYFRGRNTGNTADIAMIGIGSSGSVAPNKILIDPDNNGTQFGGSITGIVGSFSSSVSAPDIVSSSAIYLRYNGSYLYGRNGADNAYIPLIRINGSDQVSIDNNGVGTVFGGGISAISFSGAGTGLTGLASNLTAGYIHNRYWATDANNIWQSGVYTFYNGTNVPGGDFGMLSIPVFSGSDASNKYNLQIGAGISGDPKYRITDIYGAGTWYTILTAYNYNSYSPTLTGTGASGTWSINISGTAGYANGLNTIVSAATDGVQASDLYAVFGQANSDNKIRRYNAGSLQTFLGLGSAAYVLANQNLNTSSNVTFANVTGNHYTNATTSVTSNYTVADGIGVVFANASGGGFTVTLPTASSCTGRVIYVAQTNCGAIEGSVAISGCYNLTSLNRNRPGGTFISNGSTWYCVANAYISPTVCD